MKEYHLFISHSWNHDDHYNDLVNLLDQASGFSYHDHSIPKNDPVHSKSDKELSEAIRKKMMSCGIIIVLAGVYATYSKWIDKEIEIAKSAWGKPKPILAIRPHGNTQMSADVNEAADQIVNWNTKSIVHYIKHLA